MQEFGGRTHIEKYEGYTKFLQEVAIQDYQKTSGFVELTFLRNIQNNERHFTLITYWDNIEVIKNFAGNDFEKTKYYPEDTNYLLEYEEKVLHYEVFAKL